MKYQVIGVQRKTGDFSPKDKPGTTYHYDNFVLHCVGKNMSVSGQICEQLKVKAESAGQLLAEVGGAPENLIGHIYDFDVNFGRIVNYELLK